MTVLITVSVEYCVDLLNQCTPAINETPYVSNTLKNNHGYSGTQKYDIWNKSSSDRVKRLNIAE